VEEKAVGMWWSVTVLAMGMCWSVTVLAVGTGELPLMNFFPSKLSALVRYPAGYLYAAWWNES
jgi:hypothetical protein